MNAVYYNLGYVLQITGRLKEAETAYGDALAICKQLAADFPTRPEFRHDLARSLNPLALLLQTMDRLKEAETTHAAALALLNQLAADFPTRPEFRQDLARSHSNLGILLRATGRPKEAEAAYAAALVLARQLAADFPNQPDLRNSLAGTYVILAHLRLDQREIRGAKAYLEEAVPHHESALKANPRHPGYRQQYRNNLAALIVTNAHLGDQAGAKQAAEKLRDLGWDPPGNTYDAARGLALCIRAVQEDDQATKEERDKQAAFYGDEAMKMLRDAVAKGYQDAAQMDKHSEFAPLRERDAYKKLLAELKAKQK